MLGGTGAGSVYNARSRWDENELSSHIVTLKGVTSRILHVRVEKTQNH